MGEIRDVVDTIVGLRGEFKDQLTQAGVYSTKRSISASAMEGTANFPMLVDDNISLDDSMLIARAAEKKFASFLLTVLTMDPYLSVTKGETPSAEKYLRQFHQNMRVKEPVKGLHISLTDFLSESTDVDYTSMESEAFRLATAIYEGVKQSIPQGINVLCNYTVEEVTTPDSLNERFRVEPAMEGKKNRGGKGGGGSNGGGGNPPDDGGDVYNNEYNIDTNIIQNNSGDITQQGGHLINNNIEPKIYNNMDPNVDARTTFKKGAIDARHTSHIHMPENKAPKTTVRDRGGQWRTLSDNDCKKANDLVPTLLHVRVYPIDKYTKEEYTPIDFVMGVKATLHPMPVDEIARMTVAAMRNENLVFNFIRWTTGEIKFFKDFLFAIDTMKMDARDSGNDVTGWRPALKKRRLLSKSKIQFTGKSVLPNASLVISDSSVEYIKESYGYDLSDERIIRRMMDTYFLISYVLVNSVNQRATFRFDGIGATDTYTFDTLRKENQSDDKAFKNMMKMLGRSM